MKEFIKENWFKILLIIAVFLYVGLLGFREYKGVEKQKCLESCYYSISEKEDFKEQNLSHTTLLEKCSTKCNYLPNSF